MGIHYILGISDSRFHGNDKRTTSTATGSCTASNTLKTGTIPRHRHTMAFGTDVAGISSLSGLFNFGAHRSSFLSD
jgi:hypothetical protein